MASQDLGQLFGGSILGIETSCDETSAAVVEGLRIRSNVVSSQAELHKKWGGIVPEAASRAHVEAILPAIEEALALAGLRLSEVKGVAVTSRPGLIGALSVGVTAAKGLSFSLGISMIGIHHLEGHILSPLAVDPELQFPHVCLMVSGGHTELVFVRAPGDYELIGETMDDAAGEAFDKSARLLGLGYPGGAEIENAASSGDASRYSLPKGLVGRETLDFSFSGLKTAVLRLVESEGAKLSVPDAAASVQEAITSVLEERAISATRLRNVETLTLVGGVAANNRLRERLATACSREGTRLVIPPPELCTDNAAMIGIAGAFRLGLGERDGCDLEPMSQALLPSKENSPSSIF